MVHTKKVMVRFMISVLSLMAMGTGCNETDIASYQEVDSPAPSIAAVSDRPMLSVRIRKDKTDKTKRMADIVFAKSPDNEGPRVAEIFLKYSDGLRYQSCTAGSALNASNKTLVTQAIENDRLRLVVYGADNANTIDAGVLATVTFEVREPDSNTLEIVAERPVFAPSAVNDGLLIADPVTFE